MTNQEAINHLFLQGVINQSTRTQLSKRSDKLDVKAQKVERQNRVNGAVAFAVGSLLEGQEAIQHRAVWNLVGREAASRDEVLNSLRALREDGALVSFKKSGNNFQVFWAKPSAEAVAEV